MTREEIENELADLYKDLNMAYSCDEDTVCKVFNVDSKKQLIRLITSDIDTYEELLKEFDVPENDGMDYKALQLSQGLPVVYW